MERLCGNCVWFKAEPSTEIEGSAPIGTVRAMKSLGDATISSDSEPPVYGKCKATFQNSDNTTEAYDFGAFSTDECTAVDDNGYPLFSAG